MAFIFVNLTESGILNQPETYRLILLYLQAVNENTISEVGVQYKRNTPFYFVHKNHLVVERRKRMISLHNQSHEDINDAILIKELEEKASFILKSIYRFSNSN